jgi:uncharacterized protein VirK/YbjX
MNYRSTTIRILSKHFNLPCEVMFCIWIHSSQGTRFILANAITRIDYTSITSYINKHQVTCDWINHGHLACVQWFYDYLDQNPSPSCAVEAIKRDHAHIVEWLLAREVIVPSKTWYDMAERHNAQKCVSLLNTLANEFEDDDSSSSSSSS